MSIGQVYQLLKQKKYKDAEELLIQIMQSRGENASFRSLLASIYLKQNRIAEALQLADEVLNETNHYEAYAVKGLALAETGEFEEASNYLDLSLSLRDNSFYRSRLVLFYLKTDHLDEAERHLQKLLDQEPDNAYYRKLQSKLLNQRGKKKEALEVFHQSDGPSLEDPFEYSQYIRMKLKSKSVENGIKELQALMTIPKHSNNPHLLTLLGELQAKGEYYFEAEKTLLEALNMLPTSNYLKQRLGFLYSRMNEPEKVITFLRPHFLQKPGDVIVRKTLISAYEKLGRNADLVDLLEQALVTHPEIKALYGIKHRTEKKLGNSRKKEVDND